MDHSRAINLTVVLNVWGNDDPMSLKRSLRSIKAQETKASEIVVVIDGPISSEHENVIDLFASEIDNIVRIPIASGLWNARNIGIRVSSTDFVAFHDADDVMHPQRLSLQIKAIEESDADVVASPVYEFDSASERIIGYRKLCDNGNLSKKMIWQNVINHSSVLIKRSAVLDVGGYRNIHLAEDYDLWIRMIQKRKKFFCLDPAVQAFSVDPELTKRRGGFNFIRSELAISQTISDLGELNAFESKLRLVSRIFYRIGPRFIRKFHRRLFQVKRQEEFHSLSEFLTSKIM